MVKIPFKDSAGRNYIGGIGTDITQRKKDEVSLRLASKVFSVTREGITITDVSGNIIEINDAFSRITGYSRDEVIGKNPRILKSGHQSKDFYLEMWKSLQEAGHWSGEIWNRRKSGEVYAEWLNISAITDDAGNKVNYVAVFSDITGRKKHETYLEKIAHFDALTGIPNRVLLSDRMRQAIAKLKRENSILAVCFLDLDGFKSVNDTLGHDAGDQVLVEVSKRITHLIRGGDTVARLGGDEFVVLLDVKSLDECRRTVDRLLEAIGQPILIKNESVRVGASIGIAMSLSDHCEPEQLLEQADLAMYEAKNAGKNQYRFFATVAKELGE